MTGSEEILEHYAQLLQEVDLFVCGRKTYQLMVPYWPNVAKDDSATRADKDFARTFDFWNKIVFSRSLDSAEGNTRIVRTNLQEKMLKLKQERAKKIFSSAAWIFLHNLSSLVWWMNIVLSFIQSLPEKGDGCWRASACARNCN